MTEELFITIIGFGSLMFILLFLACTIIYRSFKDYPYKDGSSTRGKVRSIYDSILTLRKVLKSECCINRTAGELFDELEDEIYQLYKEYQ